MKCNTHLTRGHGYIITEVDYFTTWIEAMPTYKNTSEAIALFFFNHFFAMFGVPQAIVINHGKHFHNHMVYELIAKLGLSHESSTPYCPQVNGQVEAVNKDLKKLLHCTIGIKKSY